MARNDRTRPRASGRRPCRRPVGGHRPGFTLVEVLVALAVGGLVVLAARALVEGVTAAARRTVDAGAAADADANGLRLARTLVDQVDVTAAADAEPPTGAGVAAQPPVTGDGATVRLTTWCAAAGGWAVPCTATLRLDGAGDASAGASTGDRSGTEAGPAATDLVADLSTGERLVLRRGLTGASFRYLVTAADGGRWSAEWARREAPLAIAVVGSVDTLLLSVGARQ